MWSIFKITKLRFFKKCQQIGNCIFSPLHLKELVCFKGCHTASDIYFKLSELRQRKTLTLCKRSPTFFFGCINFFRGRSNHNNSKILDSSHDISNNPPLTDLHLPLNNIESLRRRRKKTCITDLCNLRYFLQKKPTIFRKFLKTTSQKLKFLSEKHTMMFDFYFSSNINPILF